jgi:uncharacterized membrane protein
MLAWLVKTVLIAVPFALPVLIFMIAKKIGFRWRAQKLLLSLALAVYALSLFAFAMHARASGVDPGEFFRAFYGSPVSVSHWCMAGYVGQILAVVCLLFVVNWKTVRLFYGEDVDADTEGARRFMRRFAWFRKKEAEKDGRDVRETKDGAEEQDKKSSS